MTMSAVDIVRAFDEAVIYDADFDRAMTYAHPELTVREAPSLPYRSPYIGRQGLVDLMADVGSWWEFPEPHHLAYYAVTDELVIGRIWGKSQVRATGREVDFLVTEWITVKDEKVVDIEVFYFDQGPLLEAAALVAGS